MKKKKLFAIPILILIVIIALFAGYNVYRHPSLFRSQNNTALSSEEVGGLINTLKENDNNKVLVAYFSYSGTTERIAEALSERTDADIFEISVKEPYKNVYTQSNSEIRGNKRPEINVTPNLPDDYDIIFVGFPIWWHATPLPINTFLESYDLSGKLIIPFCTSMESGIEEAMPTFLNSCDGYYVYDGKRIVGTDQFDSWLDEIGLFEKTDENLTQ